MSDKEPIICFGQQPCGFFPRRFLWSKILTARRLQSEIGGRVVFFVHDSDHDPRETQTELVHKNSGKSANLNFAFKNKIQKKYTPLYAKSLVEGWQRDLGRQLPQYISKELADVFMSVDAETVSDFCMEMYRRLGLLEGVECVYSGNEAFRENACEVSDFFVDTEYRGELVRARLCEGGKLKLHQGGSSFLSLEERSWEKQHISPTRDTRLLWMQSVIGCTHYIAGAGEMKYLNMDEAPEIQFVERDFIENASAAYTPESL